MKKKSLDRKAAQRTIMDGRASGKTDQEIYYELSQEGYDKKAIALLVTGTVTAENKAKYKTHNNILLALMGLMISLLAVGVFNSSDGNWALIGLFVPLANIFYGIAQYYAPTYRALGFLIIIGFFLINAVTILLETVYGPPNPTVIFFYLILTGIISALSFYLDRKLFPNFRPLKLKKGGNGEYIL